jgi:hypothetical protein
MARANTILRYKAAAPNMPLCSWSVYPHVAFWGRPRDNPNTLVQAIRVEPGEHSIFASSANKSS